MPKPFGRDSKNNVGKIKEKRRNYYSSDSDSDYDYDSISMRHNSRLKKEDLEKVKPRPTQLGRYYDSSDSDSDLTGPTYKSKKNSCSCSCSCSDSDFDSLDGYRGFSRKAYDSSDSDSPNSHGVLKDARYNDGKRISSISGREMKKEIKRNAENNKNVQSRSRKIPRSSGFLFF
jgi:hypothetical protein